MDGETGAQVCGGEGTAFSACVCDPGGAADIVGAGLQDVQAITDAPGGWDQSVSGPDLHADLERDLHPGVHEDSAGEPDTGAAVDDALEPAPDANADVHATADADADAAADVAPRVDAMGAPDACISEEGCTAVGVRRCVEEGGAYRECEEVAAGCLRWSEAVECDEDDVCEDGYCLEVCVPDCAGRACGADGCGGRCGECPDQHVCLADGSCLCLPACDGRECGLDGCGGDCGTCDEHEFCNRGACDSDCLSDSGCTEAGLLSCAEAGEAVRFCTEVAPGCLQWGVPVPCGDGEVCDAGACFVPCTSDAGCTEVGLIACANEGGARRTCMEVEPGCLQWDAPVPCGEGEVCDGGRCYAPCISDEGCTESGRTVCADEGEAVRFCEEVEQGCHQWADPVDCDDDERCFDGECVFLCVPDCSGRECGSDGCGGTCGQCASDESCLDARCVCVPDCVDRECGDDGCGSSCGSCPDGLLCSEGRCVCDEHACAANDDCASDCYCDAAVSPAVCRTRRDAGETCLHDRHCASELVCNSVSLPPRCQAPGDAGAPCLADAHCADGLICYTAASPIVCRAPADEGEPCTDAANCRAGLVCNRTYMPPQCARPAQEVGALCLSNEDCAVGLLCNAAYDVAQCHPPGTEPGLPCLTDVHCGAGLLCSGLAEPTVCLAPSSEVGAACLSNAYCAGELVCGPGGTCTAGLEGDLCGPTTCAAGLVCNSRRGSRCVPPSEFGDVCANRDHCVTVEAGGAHLACILGQCSGWTDEIIVSSRYSYDFDSWAHLTFDRQGFFCGTSYSDFFTDRFGPLLLDGGSGGTRYSDYRVVLAGIDPHARAHALFAVESRTGREMFYYRWRSLTGGSAWTTETLPGLSLPPGSSGRYAPDASAVLDPAGQLHVAFCDDEELWYATNAPGHWERELGVESGADDCAKTNIDLASGGEPGIAFLEESGGWWNIVYAIRRDGQWTSENVTSELQRPSIHSLRFSAGDVPHLLTMHEGVVWHRWRSADGWGAERLPTLEGGWDDVAGGYGQATQVDADGHLHVLLARYREPGTVGQLYYVTNRTGRWMMSLVASRSGSLGIPALSVRPSGDLSVLYWVKGGASAVAFRATASCPCAGEQPCDASRTPPVCVGPAGEGEVCGGDVFCETGQYCNDAYEPRRCEPPATVSGEPCSHENHCGDELYCSALGHCEFRGREGDACDPGRPCLAGLYCNSAGVSPVCLPPGSSGAPCLLDIHCEAGLICNLAEQPPACGALGGEGDLCLIDRDCVEELFCNLAEEPPICGTQGEMGTPCLYDRYCAEGLVCNTGYVPSVCRPVGSAGEPCQYDKDCADGLGCNRGAGGSSSTGLCRPPGVSGEACEDDEDCADGYLCNAAYAPPQCEAPAETAGLPCLADFHCSEAMYCAPTGVCLFGDLGDPCVDTCAPGLVCNRWYLYEGPDGVAQCTVPGLPGDLCYNDADCGVALGGGLRTCVSRRCTDWTRAQDEVTPPCSGFLTFDTDGALHGVCFSLSAYFTNRFGATESIPHEPRDDPSGFWGGMDRHLFVHALFNEDGDFHGRICHAKYLVTDPDAAWVETCIDQSPNVTRSDGTLAHEDATMEPDGSIHIAACADGQLWYLTNATGDWLSETVGPSGGDACHEPAIAHSPTGAVHIVWERSLFGDHELLYATGRAGSWDVETLVEDIADDKGPLALVVSDEDVPHVVVGQCTSNVWSCARDSTPWESLVHLSKSGEEWASEEILLGNVDKEVRGGYREAMALDGSGALHLAVSVDAGWSYSSHEIVYATNRGGEWSTETIQAYMNSMSTPAVYVGDDDEPRIALLGRRSSSAAYGIHYYERLD